MTENGMDIQSTVVPAVLYVMSLSEKVMVPFETVPMLDVRPARDALPVANCNVGVYADTFVLP
jgi:hypothetical protein